MRGIARAKEAGTRGSKMDKVTGRIHLQKGACVYLGEGKHVSGSLCVPCKGGS